MTILDDLLIVSIKEPLTVAQMVDLNLYLEVTRAERLKKDRESKKLKANEDKAQELLLDQLLKNHRQGFVTEGVRVMWEGPAYVPHVDNWDKLYAHILAMEDFSLLERRVGRAAVQERWDTGAEVPGVEKYPVFKVTKQKGQV